MRNIIKNILRESRDPFDWIKEIEPEIYLKPEKVYCFEPNLTLNEIHGLADRIKNSDDIQSHLKNIAEFPWHDLRVDGVSYFMTDKYLRLGSWCTETTCEEISRRYDGFEIIDARSEFYLR